MAKAPAPKFYEGQRFHKPGDNSAPVLIYSKGKFIPETEYTPPKQPGQIDPLTSSPNALVPMNLGFGPAVQAQKDMYKAQGWGSPKGYSNPILSSPGSIAAELTRDFPIVGQFAPLLGSKEYREDLQGRKAYEASLLPIFSGANVTASEALRQIAGNLPAASDIDPVVAKRKMINRSMMVNGIADMQGKPRPFPQVGALYPDPKQGLSKQPPATVRKPKGGSSSSRLPADTSYVGILDPNK